MACDSSSPKFCCYNIPICGGFCAPTENPDESCYRHVSNEFTIPASPKFMMVAPLCEHSPCCILCGQIGVPALAPYRKCIFTFAATANIVAAILCLIAAVSGLSTDAGKLENLPWVKGVGTLCPTTGTCADTKLYIGITARYAVTATSSQVSKWDDASSCDGALIPSLNEMCQDCKDNLLASTTLITGIISAFPTITTDFQRTTTFGDVNCQSSFGVLSNIFSFVMTFTSLWSFRTACFSDLPNSFGTGSTMDWEMGPGFRCLMGATIIKVIDIFCHLLVQTPAVRWRKPDKAITDVTDYMKLVGQPVELSGEVIGK
mmetsp:Transcript_123457/g.193668  ORF Transcript_123457/g.193668 Transcript_123457/m.193668 type:complete len:317 (+) Transcript_123457:66-1016(+)